MRMSETALGSSITAREGRRGALSAARFIAVVLVSALLPLQTAVGGIPNPKPAGGSRGGSKNSGISVQNMQPIQYGPTGQNNDNSALDNLRKLNQESVEPNTNPVERKRGIIKQAQAGPAAGTGPSSSHLKPNEQKNTKDGSIQNNAGASQNQIWGPNDLNPPAKLLNKIPHSTMTFDQLLTALESKLRAAGFDKDFAEKIRQELAEAPHTDLREALLSFLASENVTLVKISDSEKSMGMFYDWKTVDGQHPYSGSSLTASAIPGKNFVVALGTTLSDHPTWSALLLHEGMHSLHGYLQTNGVNSAEDVKDYPYVRLMRAAFPDEVDHGRGPQTHVALQEILANYASSGDWNEAYSLYRKTYSPGNLFGDEVFAPLFEAVFEKGGGAAAVKVLVELAEKWGSDISALHSSNDEHLLSVLEACQRAFEGVAQKK